VRPAFQEQNRLKFTANEPAAKAARLDAAKGKEGDDE
jgi:hypothetical protein